MGKKGFNWKARRVVDTVIDDSSTKKIKLDLDVQGTYDSSNQLVLPSAKRKTKIKRDGKQPPTKILSKRHRKKLEKIIDKKKKKENRASLLEALQSVRAQPELLQQLTSIATVQTKGLKRYQRELEEVDEKQHKKEQKDVVVKVNSIAGSKRKVQPKQKATSNDPNIVGFDLEDDSSDTTDSEIDEEKLTDKIMKVEDENRKIDDTNANTNIKTDELTVTTVNTNAQTNESTVTINNNEEAPKDTLMKSTKMNRIPAVFVDVNRREEIQEARLKLPILAEEQVIMETINENDIVIIAGETGSGKTTQLPQFLYEAGYATDKQIAVTEPRRVAAITMSKRVGDEMNLPDEVSYLIRFEGNTTERTKIKFMTDGVLLKEVQSDFLLTKYSVVILDEAHERSVYTDILIGLLSRIVPLRRKKGDPLKLIIMSATLRLKDFTENRRLFKKDVPVIKVEARQFPVTVHFNKVTKEDYLKEAFNKAVKIHTKLPDGGILIFVTGQSEVNGLVKKLRKAFPLRKNSKLGDCADEKIDDRLRDGLKKRKKLKVLPKINLDDYSLPGDNEIETDSDDIGDDSDSSETPLVVDNTQPLWVLPLYSLLPSHKQAKIFNGPPPGCRFCVIATNVAETSLTIPNIKYVIDTGKTKVKLYDKVTGVTTYFVTWTSKASADQRAGRAGRLGPGHCYRLYSSAVFNDTFEDFSVPEIQQKPVDDLYLQMKCMNIDKITNFPFPTAPNLLQLKTAENNLQILGALNKDTTVTPLGRAISKFPVLPRFGKMLALSHQQNLLPYTVCLVAALSVQEVLMETPIQDEDKSLRKKWSIVRQQWAGSGNALLLGDAMVLLHAVGAAEYANSLGKLEKFCQENGLRHKAVIEIRKLRIQLTNEIKLNVPDSDIIVDPKLSPPTDQQAKLLRQILLSGMGDRVAKKIMPHEVNSANTDKSKYKYAYRTNNLEDPVFLHHGSVLRKTLPEYVVYQELYETNKIYMRGVTAVEPEWLPIYVPTLCDQTQPLSEPPPYYNNTTGKIHCTVKAKFGPQSWELPQIETEHPKTVDKYKWFSKFFLEGKVCPKLSKYAVSLLSTPGVMLKSWANLQPRTIKLLQALTSWDVSSKGDLTEAWSKNPKYLLHEYLLWLPESAHNEVSLIWPPL